VGALIGIRTSNAPSLSPDGKRVAYLTNITGSPQVWTVSTQGGWPELVTSFDDPVTGVEWSPAGDWLAVQVAPCSRPTSAASAASESASSASTMGRCGRRR
jgi:Tol biopolymer transport system component